MDQTLLESVLEQFVGPQQQLPPQFSAKKVNGQTAHKVARQGGSIDLALASIVIYGISRIHSTPDSARIRVQCSAGTYIRTLCHDIGTACGVGAYMTSLRRLQIGELPEDAMQPLETLLQAETLADILQPVTHKILMAPRVILTPQEHRTAFHGQDPGIPLSRIMDVTEENANLEYIVGYLEEGPAAVLFSRPAPESERPDVLFVRRVIEAPES